MSQDLNSLQIRYFRFWENEYICRNKEFKEELLAKIQKLKDYTSNINKERRIYEDYMEMITCFPWDEWTGNKNLPEPIHEWVLFCDKYLYDHFYNEKLKYEHAIDTVLKGNIPTYRGLDSERDLTNLYVSGDVLMFQFNINSNIDDVLKEIKERVEYLKNLNINKYTNISYKHINIVPLNSRNNISKSNGDYKSFRIDSIKSRAAGLWIWDRVQELGGERGSIAKAIRELRNNFDLEKLCLINADDAAMRFYYKRTDECINTCAVLPFSRNGN